MIVIIFVKGHCHRINIMKKKVFFAVDLGATSGRTIAASLEDGKLVRDIKDIKNEEWRGGLFMEELLHETLLDIAGEDMTFEELHGRIDALAEEKGYRNLDCLGNFGHSIEKRDEDRIYSEKGNARKLSSVSMFTFEPHISLPGSKYGFKQEDIYYFSDGRLKRM